ncbi:MAG: acyl-CoA thioesterase [Verrucomicrobiota bacterium]
MIECRLRYKAPARYDDVLTTELWLTQIDRVRLNFAFRILNQTNTLILEGETHHVCTGLNEKLKRLPEELVSKLQPYLRPIAG